MRPKHLLLVTWLHGPTFAGLVVGPTSRTLICRRKRLRIRRVRVSAEGGPALVSRDGNRRASPSSEHQLSEPVLRFTVWFLKRGKNFCFSPSCFLPHSHTPWNELYIHDPITGHRWLMVKSAREEGEPVSRSTGPLLLAFWVVTGMFLTGILSPKNLGLKLMSEPKQQFLCSHLLWYFKTPTNNTEKILCKFSTPPYNVHKDCIF